MDGSNFYYHVSNVNGTPVIYFEPINHWINNKCLVDHYSKPEQKFINSVIKQLHMDELTHSMYEPNNEDFDINMAVISLVELGFTINDELSRFLERHN